MAVLTVQKAALGGTEITTVAAAGGGDEAPTGDRRFLYVRNGGASPVTVTLATPGTVSGIPIGDPAPAVAASGVLVVPLKSVYRNASGRAAITYSAVTSVTVAVIELP